MLDTLEFVLRILFFALSITWAGKIMILRTDKQIVINPLLIIISSLLVMLPSSNEGIELLGISVQNIKISIFLQQLCTCQQKLDTKLKKSGIKNESMYKIHQLF